MLEIAERIESIFAAVVALPHEQRSAFLDQACGDAPMLRPQIEGLLRAHDKANHLLDRPAVGANATGVHVSQLNHPGDVIGGRYKLLEQIGAGGMGAVWMAEQKEPVKRKVAIKLVKAGMDSAQVLARFEAERQALALMDHPNIAKVFDGGVTDHGRPFFVMEFVKGVPLTEYCNEARLSLKERLNLFIPVCQAVQHAHQKGIIHRDLKPSNILICLYDGQPVPKVIDFGLAKAMHQSLTENTVHTAIGMMVGTPLYMSPEQAELNNLDVDTRTDIYSLGVILYEILTGSTPLEQDQLKQAAFNEILRLIKEVEPPKPSTRLSGSVSLPSIAAQRSIEPGKLSKLLSGDLDWIVMKSLEKERSRRYETASGLARDVERFLSDEAVEASPPSSSYRLKKLMRKHRTAINTAVGFAAILILGSSVSVWLAIRARNAEAAAKEALEQTENQRKAAEMHQARAEKAAQQSHDDFVASTNDVITKLIGSKSELGPHERAYLESTRKRWEAYADRQQNDEVGQVLRAEGYKNIAAIWHKLREFNKALEYWDLEKEVRKRLTQQSPEHAGHQFFLACSLGNSGHVNRQLGDSQRARADYDAAIALLHRLVERDPSNPEYISAVAQVRMNLANVMCETGEVDRAKKLYREATELLRRIVDVHPERTENLLLLGVCHENLGRTHCEQSEFTDALSEYLAAHAVAKKLYALEPHNEEFEDRLASACNSVGLAYRELGRMADSIAMLESAIEIQKRRASRYPAMLTYQVDLGGHLCNLGLTIKDFGDYSKSLDYLNTAIQTMSLVLEKTPSDAKARSYLYNSLWGRSMVYEAQQDFVGAASDFDAMITVATPEQKTWASFQAARCLLRAEKFAEAEMYLQRGLALRQFAVVDEKERDRESRTLVAQYMIDTGRLYLDMNQFEAARKWLDLACEESRKLQEKWPGDEAATQMRNSCRFRAEAKTRLKRFDEAESDWDNALNLSSPKEQTSIQIVRALTQVRAGQIEIAIDEANRLSTAMNLSGVQIYDCACVHSIASGLTKERRKEYGDRAMVLLTKAIQAGYNDVAHLQRDSDLDPLRERDDLKQLLAELVSKNPQP